MPAGTVQVYKGSKLLGTGTLSNGKVTIKVSKKKAKKFKVGKVTLTAKYLGSATVAASQADFESRSRRRSLAAGQQWPAGRAGTTPPVLPARRRLCGSYSTAKSRQNGFPAGSA